MRTINEYIKEHNISVSNPYVYEDEYSASRSPKSSSIDDEKPFTRRGLNNLIDNAKLKKFDTVMVYNHDRLTRNVQESLLLKFFFDKLKIKVIYCKPGENVDTESEKLNIFYENLLNNLSALESNMIGSRTRLGNEYNIKNGYWAGGPPPYGYKLIDIYTDRKKRIFDVSYSEARIVIEIFNLYLQGNPPVRIAQYIKNKYPDNGDRKWTKNSIISIVKNEDYTGVMVWDKKGGVKNPVRHKKSIISCKYEKNIIINDELWDQIKKIRDILRLQPKFFSSPFLLNRYLVCGKCGKEMRTKNNGGTKGRVYYCIKEEGKWEACVNAELIEPNVINKLGEHLTSVLINNDNFNMFYEKYKLTFNSKKNINEKASMELQLQIDENMDYLDKCKFEIDSMESELDPCNKDEYNTKLNFIESLKELHSYLNINLDIIRTKKKEIDNKINSTIYSKDILKEFISQKKNLLDNIENNSTDKQKYRRGLKFLLYDLVDKIIYNEDKSIDIMIK